MIKKEVLQLYKKFREPYISKYFVGVSMSRAGHCLAHAKRVIKINRIWDVLEECGLVRLVVEPDHESSYEDLAGDSYDIIAIGDSISGGARTVKAQEKKFAERCQQGAVMVSSEIKCSHCSSFETVNCIGGLFWDDWEENECVNDLKESAIDRIKGD